MWKVTRKYEQIVQIIGTAKLEILAEDQCSTKFNELENIAAGKKHLGFTNHCKWQDNMTSGRKSKLFADIW